MNRCSVLVRLEKKAAHRLGQMIKIAQQYRGTCWGRGQANQFETLDIALPSEDMAKAFMYAVDGLEGVACLLEFVGNQRVNSLEDFLTGGEPPALENYFAPVEGVEDAASA